ncbi:MAG: class I adenylate-forming enzyme family protein, partial [Alphaproteobacteria bacterium]|nr:class I adenylate-forming enzyme family protein [Alphaproteobacteria bacterium]
MRLSIAENVAVRALAHPERTAIEVLDGGPTLTYGQVWCRIVALAEALTEAEAGRHGRMVALLLPNEADGVLAFMACQVAGVAAVPISTRLAEPEIRYVVEDADAKVILTGGEFAETAANLGVKVVRVEDIATPDSVERPVLGEAGRGAEPCVVGYTSGTTGFPKGALYSNDHYLTGLMRWGWEFGITADQVMLVPGPLFHLSYAGLSMTALCIGARIRVMPEFRADLALSELSHHCTHAFLVPSMTTMIEEEWRRQGQPPIDAFRLMISSGAPGPLSMTKTAMEMFHNAKVTEAYGWTEGGWVTFEVKAEDTLLAHSVGWPTFGNEVQVFDEAGEVCP